MRNPQQRFWKELQCQGLKEKCSQGEQQTQKQQSTKTLQQTKRVLTHGQPVNI
jgi:hypothetical protein